jgi:hypothetical protein
MNIYKRRSLKIHPQQLEVICKMYPYGSLDHRDIRAESVSFLASEFPNVPGDTELIAVRQHNGRGYQWGIMLLHLPGDSLWTLVGEFGHGSIPYKSWYVQDRFAYLCLLRFGVTMSNFQGPPPNGSMHMILVKDLPAFCHHRDNFDPWEEFLKLGKFFAEAD